jgi:hypothetical protein
LEDLLGREGIPIDDERVLNHIDHPAISDSLIRSMNSLANKIHPHQSTSEYVIVSVDACERLLRQIEDEENTQDWLESLVITQSKSN